MSVSTDLQAAFTPQADASRVAAIRNSLDPRDGETVAAFGERARLDVTASMRRLLAEVRGAAAAEAPDLLRKAAELIAAQDPSRLTVEGVARLFVGPRKRLNKVRAEFQHAAALLEALASDMTDRAEQLGRRSNMLDRLHAQAKTLILELDAFVDAGRLAVAAIVDKGDGDAGRQAPKTRIEARLEALMVTRRGAIEQLSLVRVIQNVDTPLAGALTEAARASRCWIGDWSELLGLSADRRGKRIRPDAPALYETKAQALDRLVSPTAAVAEARRRRQDAETRMEDLADSVASTRN